MPGCFRILAEELSDSYLRGRAAGHNIPAVLARPDVLKTNFEHLIKIAKLAIPSAPSIPEGKPGKLHVHPKIGDPLPVSVVLADPVHPQVHKIAELRIGRVRD